MPSLADREQTPIIHRFWAGPREMPEEYEAFGGQWKDLNPGWVVFDHTEDVQDHFPALFEVFQDLYARDDGRQGIELYVQLADVLGYAIVEKWGGVYVNCDMQPVNPFPVLPKTAWASYENDEDGRIVNAAIGAPFAHDPFWAELLDELPGRYWKYRYDEMVMATGPGFLTDFAAPRMDQLHVFPRAAFNPVHWKQIQPGGDASTFVQARQYSDETIAVHHWGHKRDGRSNTIETATQ